MALNIKNDDVERMLDDVVRMTGESKTEAVRRALSERQQRLTLRVAAHNQEIRLLTFLEDEVWPLVPEEGRGVRLSKEEEEAILGYGEYGA